MAFPQLLARQMDFSFRMAVQSGVIFRVALQPLPAYERVGVPASKGS